LVAVKAHEVENVLRRAAPGAPVLLIYGPDSGLVAERARVAAERAVEDASDPFQLIRLEGDVVAADPGRLADEAGTIGLFGSRRVIWVKPSSRNLAPAVEAVLASPLRDVVIVIEAGDLAKSSPLRTLCERSSQALALPCYADNERDLAAVVDATVRDAGLTIGRDARTALLGALGGDRLATRGELTKLLLYAHGTREVTLDDVDAVVSDVSALAVDGVIDAAFAGDLAALDDGLQRLAAEGMSASTLLGAALRHALLLMPAVIDVAGGRGAGDVVDALRGLHFRRKDAVRRQLAAWKPAPLRRVVEALQDAVLASRRSAELGSALAQRVLLDIAAQTRRARA
jgi:DNA polymerase-3 subunit delta